MRYVPVGEEDAWRQRAVEVAGEGRLDTLIGFWVEMGEFPRLAQRLRGASNGELEGISHYITEKAAEGLAEEYPDVAARVYRALGMRVLHSKKRGGDLWQVSGLRSLRPSWSRPARSG